MNPIVDRLLSHRSIRKFTEQAISSEQLEVILAAGQAAASSSFLQAVSVVRVTDVAVRTKFAALSGGQAYVETCAEFLVFVADFSRAKMACEKENKPFNGGFIEQLLIAVSDASLVAQNCVIAAESMGLGICYIGGIRNDPAQVVELLDLPEQSFGVFGLCLGYPAQDPEVKPRLPINVFLHQEKYQKPDNSQINEYNTELSRYYQMRTGNNKTVGWTDQIANIVGDKESRPHMMAFLHEQGLAKR